MKLTPGRIAERFRGSPTFYETYFIASALFPGSNSQTVSVLPATFGPSGLSGLVVVNQGLQSFSVLLTDHGGGYTDPQPALTFATGSDPGPIVAGDFNALVNALESNTAYANVHTVPLTGATNTAYPGGEIRGQVHSAEEEQEHDHGH